MLINPALPTVGSASVLVLETVALLAVSVPTFKKMPPAGAAPLVSAVILAPLVRVTSFAVILITVDGVGLGFGAPFESVGPCPPVIVVLMVLLSRLTVVTELPAPLGPCNAILPALPAFAAVLVLLLEIVELPTVSVPTAKPMVPAGAAPLVPAVI